MRKPKGRIARQDQGAQGGAESAAGQDPAQAPGVREQHVPGEGGQQSDIGEGQEGDHAHEQEEAADLARAQGVAQALPEMVHHAPVDPCLP